MQFEKTVRTNCSLLFSGTGEVLLERSGFIQKSRKYSKSFTKSRSALGGAVRGYGERVHDLGYDLLSLFFPIAYAISNLFRDGVDP